MTKIIDTRWQHNRTGHVLRITGTNAARSFHEAEDETSAYAVQIAQADLDADYTQVDDKPKPAEQFQPRSDVDALTEDQRAADQGEPEPGAEPPVEREPEAEGDGDADSTDG